jgi:perosamine synthetase
METRPKSVSRYQQAFAQWLGVDHAFAFWKGRVALYAILRGLNIGEGDEVLVAGYTCVMAVNPIMYLGATPIFIDIEPITYNMDPNQIEDKITVHTKLIIAQHTYGYPADLDAILDIAGRKGLPVIEDSCLSLGSMYKGKVVGTFGLAAYHSFQWSKPYTSGIGGMATTSDPDLADRIHRVCETELLRPGARNVGLLAVQLAVYRTLVYPKTATLAQNLFRWLVSKGLLVGSSSSGELAPEMQDDFFIGMSGVQARSGRRQLRNLQHILDHRRRMRHVYDRLLAERSWTVCKIPDHTDPVLVRYPVRVADKQLALSTAARHFVELGSWFECPLHPIETKLEDYGYRPGMCPEAERASREVVNLPLHPRAGESTAKRSVDFVVGIGPPTR